METNSTLIHPMKFACIIPFYNESQRIDVDKYRDVFIRNHNICFYLINDGSTDCTSTLLNEIALGISNVHTYNNPRNNGKAETIRLGMLKLLNYDYEFIGFLDADFATPVLEFSRLLDIALAGSYDIVIGSRVKLKGWNIERNPVRHFFSRIVLTVINNLFSLEIYDTQCGCKIFHKNSVLLCFNEPFLTKWIFDVEIFIRYLKYVKKPNLIEIPLHEWKDIAGSKIKLIDFVSVPFSIFRIWVKN
jgi:dolichyl-phosphate beta-glucosyltransferase